MLGLIVPGLQHIAMLCYLNYLLYSDDAIKGPCKLGYGRYGLALDRNS
jgi:hypothetical protein